MKDFKIISEGEGVASCLQEKVGHKLNGGSLVKHLSTSG